MGILVCPLVELDDPCSANTVGLKKNHIEVIVETASGCHAEK